MEKYTKKFISFNEWDKESLAKAIKKAKSLGATKWNYWNALDFKWTWVLKIDETWEYYISGLTKEELLKEWYKEIFLDDDNWLECEEAGFLDDSSYEQALQAIRALSNIEWYLIEKHDMPNEIIEHIEYIFNCLKEDLKK